MIPLHRTDAVDRAVQRRRILTAAMMTALGMAIPAVASAQYPARPIAILCGSPAGSLSDILARFMAQRLGESLKQTVIVDNRPGANGSIAAGVVAKAPADGHTLMLVPDTVMVVNQFVYSKLPFNAEKDLQSVALLGKIDVLLVTNPNSGLKTFADFIQRAKEQPKGLSYASGGAGHPTHLMMELTASRLGFEVTHVPYKGTAPAIQDVASGQVQVMFVGLAEAQPLLKTGRLIALAATGPGAREQFPTLPLLKDSHPDLDLSVWFGIFGPAGMPREVVDTLNAEVNKILRAPEARARFADFAMQPSPTLVPALDALMKSDRAKYGPLVSSLGLKSD